MAALYGGFDLEATGMTLHISGFNDSMPALLQEMLTTLKNFRPEEYKDHFANVFERTRRNLKNALKNMSYQQVLTLEELFAL